MEIIFVLTCLSDYTNMHKMSITYLILFSLSIIISSFFTLFIKKIALKFNIVDKPLVQRKIHNKNIPLLGGMAIFLSFFILSFLMRDYLLIGNLKVNNLLGVFFGACFLMFGGFLDDKYTLSPLKQLIFPILAVLSVLIGGVEIEKITNPFGGYIYFNKLNIEIFQIDGVKYYFTVFSDLLISIWLILMMYTTKLLDGIDGLVTGVSAIGGIIIFLFTMSTTYYQPDIGMASLIFSGACIGFLIFNWNPATIFLGEGGSLLLGFILGVLAIISGGKIAIALLIMGIPIMDLLWTIIRRLFSGKNPFKSADRLHLHHRLLDSGIGQKNTVLIFYFFATLFGMSALFLQSTGKILAIFLLLTVMLGLIIGFYFINKKMSDNFDRKRLVKKK